MTIDAERSCGKITVIKRELQAEKSLLCLKKHTQARIHLNESVSKHKFRQENSLKSTDMQLWISW